MPHGVTACNRQNQRAEMRAAGPPARGFISRMHILMAAQERVRRSVHVASVKRTSPTATERNRRAIFVRPLWFLPDAPVACKPHLYACVTMTRPGAGQADVGHDSGAALLARHDQPPSLLHNRSLRHHTRHHTALAGCRPSWQAGKGIPSAAVGASNSVANAVPHCLGCAAPQMARTSLQPAQCMQRVCMTVK